MGPMEGGRAALERDMYHSLLELRTGENPRPKLGAILELLVAIVRAQRAYLEFYDAADRSQPSWTVAHACSPDEEREIRAVTSRGIVAAALASGVTVHTPLAALDNRFADRPSVQAQRLEAVLCIPVQGNGNGVLYIEGRRSAGPFADGDIRFAEAVARYLWPNLEHLARLAAARRVGDPTRRFRDRLRLDGVLGRSHALARVFEQLEPYGPLDVTLLITGASGTGKTQIARAIHDNSPRRNQPFVELNCAAIPEGLIESELFGTMPSAFPGARRTSGKVEAAEGGTLFLDEIAEIPFAAQAKLLQLLQSRQYYALASTHLATANIRLIAATNADLPAMVTARRFREDLLYRINVMAIRMPSLDERREDIAILVDELLPRIADEHHLRRLPASEQLRITLENRDWPGNVRQLRHVVEGALIRANAESAPQVELRHLSEAAQAPGRPPTFHEATRLYQRELLQRELAACNWNVAAVAERLDLTRSHVYNLINQFSLKRES
ncbi:MAG TPA: sigma 54-interacting transcriptional regulator [Kofleriaceae bacterium]|nr:sigma 54-interacting transcriptional regulator [Kofleriaceae bacterium]